MDRIVHNTTWIETGDYNMREHAPPASNHQPATTNRDGADGAQCHARRCRPAITPVLSRNKTRCSNLQIISGLQIQWNQPTAVTSNSLRGRVIATYSRFRS